MSKAVGYSVYFFVNVEMFYTLTFVGLKPTPVSVNDDETV
jgi:hypothetical protein